MGPQIVQIRGTSGSGKSTAARAVMERAASISPVMPGPDFPKKRKSPIGYVLDFPGRSVFIPGSYSVACGGVDTLPTYEVTFGLIREHYFAGRHVLFEGLLAAHDVKQTTALFEAIGRKNLTVLELVEPLAVCLASVEKRRSERKNPPDKPFKPDNTVRRFKEVISSVKKLEERDISVRRVDRQNIVDSIFQIFGITPQCPQVESIEYAAL